MSTGATHSAAGAVSGELTVKGAESLDRAFKEVSATVAGSELQEDPGLDF